VPPDCPNLGPSARPHLYSIAHPDKLFRRTKLGGLAVFAAIQNRASANVQGFLLADIRLTDRGGCFVGNVSAIGTKRTSRRRTGMFALEGKADMTRASVDVSFDSVDARSFDPVDARKKKGPREPASLNTLYL